LDTKPAQPGDPNYGTAEDIAAAAYDVSQIVRREFTPDQLAEIGDPTEWTRNRRRINEVGMELAILLGGNYEIGKSAYYYAAKKLLTALKGSFDNAIEAIGYVMDDDKERTHARKNIDNPYVVIPTIIGKYAKKKNTHPLPGTMAAAVVEMQSGEVKQQLRRRSWLDDAPAGVVNR
jgi:hypothetical protein